MSSTVYNHRSLQPSGPVASGAPPPPTLGQHGHSIQRLNDHLDTIRTEFDLLARDANILRQERDDYENKLNAQINELNLIRQTLYELETSHSKYRQQYEEEIQKLRSELHSASRQAPGSSSSAIGGRRPGDTPIGGGGGGSGVPPPPPPPGLPYTSDYYRDRDRDRERLGDRDRDRDRDRLVDPRDPKRLKVESGRRTDFPGGMLPKMPPLSTAPGGPGSPKSSWRDGPPPLGAPGASPKVSITPGPGSQQTINLGGGRDPRDSPSRDLARVGDREMPLGREMIPSRRPPTPTPIILADLDPHSLPPELRTESSDWFCIFNPNLPPSSLADPKRKKNLDISLVWTLSHPTVVCCVQFSADGKYLATGCNRSAQIYDVKNGNKICILTDDNAPNTGDLYIRSVRFSPDGRFLATGAEDKRIRIWDLRTKRIVVTFTGHTQEIYALDFTPDGKQIVSGSGDRTARVWDLMPFLDASPSKPPPEEDDPRYVMVLNITDSPPTPTAASANNPDATSSSSGAAGAGTNDNPGSSSNSSSSSSTDAGVTSVAVSPDGKFLAAGSLDCLVRIWDLKTGQLMDRLAGHGNSVYSVVFTPNGRGVVSGSLDRTMKFWDVGWLYSGQPKPPPGKEGGKCLMNFVGHKDYVLSVAVSHDNRWIVSGSKDRGVQFWDSKTAELQCMLQGHKNSVISIALNPVGPLLASGSGDNLARIWRYTTVSPPP